MKSNFLSKASLISLSVLSITPSLHARIPVWTFSAPSPASLEVAAQETATVQYVITNQSRKAKDLVLRAPAGVSASPCYLAGKGSTCVLNVTINGATLPKQGLHEGPILCEKNNANQCYQPASGNQLNVNLRQSIVVGTTVAIGQVFVGDDTSYTVDPGAYYSTDNGMSWALSNLIPLGAGNYYPLAVSCNDNNTCVQIGGYYDGSTNTIASYSTTDNGVNWNAGVLTPIADTAFQAISCNNGNVCITVGQDVSDPSGSAPISYFSDNLGETWLPSAPMPRLNSLAHFNSGLSCNMENCSAVGFYNINPTNNSILSYYSSDSGQTWLLSTITAPTAVNSELYNVSCNANGACAAVGRFVDSSSINHPLSYYSTNNGQTWTLSPGLPVLPGATFNAVSCNLQGCAVSGTLDNNGTFIGYYSVDFGINWVQSSWPTSPNESFAATTSTIFCSEAQFCTALGSINPITGIAQPFSYYSNDNGRSWSSVSSWPLPVNGIGGILFAVSG